MFRIHRAKVAVWREKATLHQRSLIFGQRKRQSCKLAVRLYWSFHPNRRGTLSLGMKPEARHYVSCVCAVQWRALTNSNKPSKIKDQQEQSCLSRAAVSWFCIQVGRKNKRDKIPRQYEFYICLRFLLFSRFGVKWNF